MHPSDPYEQLANMQKEISDLHGALRRSQAHTQAEAARGRRAWDRVSVSIATNLVVDLATIPGFNLYSEPRPKNRSTTDILPSNTRHHWLYVFLCIVVLPGLFDQLIHDHGIIIANSLKEGANLYFPGNDAANINLMDMIVGMAEHVITIEQVNTANEWALNCIEDAFIIYPEYHPQWTELKSRISKCFHIYGNPPSTVPNDAARIWIPPPSWNMHALFNDRKLSIMQAGQAS
uniref:Uncharacterized protein n=1 Tax=Moniliophthora roreri TaxID=221103 RepID=A0A0W0FNT1_MONRR